MKTQLALLSGIVFAFMLRFCSCSSQPPVDHSILLGYWYGSLPSNSSIGVVLYYYQEDSKTSGKVFFTDGANLTTEAAIHGLVLKGKNIDFDIDIEIDEEGLQASEKMICDLIEYENQSGRMERLLEYFHCQKRF